LAFLIQIFALAVAMYITISPIFNLINENRFSFINKSGDKVFIVKMYDKNTVIGRVITVDLSFNYIFIPMDDLMNRPWTSQTA